jgi:aminodeoxyfutalosine deaminase
VLELARRHPDSPVPTDEDELRAFYTFRDFPHFADVYHLVSDLVRDPEDLAVLVTAIGRDLAAQNVRYVELTVSPYSHVRNGMPMQAVTEALDVAARQASGIRVAYIFDAYCEYGVESIRGTLDHALRHPPENLVGFGLGGVEQKRPPYTSEIRDAFRAATASGLHSVPHAGEMTGPETIWEALDNLGAERIGHGTSCVADQRLMARLRETQIPLEVCPTSNVCTGQVPALAEHPIAAMLDAGLYVTLNSDDPPMFGTSLTEEYRRAAAAFGFGQAELAQLSRNAVNASFLPHSGKQRILAEIDDAWHP